VNASRFLLESKYRNSTSSLVFELRWPRGQKGRPEPELRGRCWATDRCTPQWVEAG